MKTILVTGVSGGIGSVIAAQLISQGYRVFGTYNRNNPEFLPNLRPGPKLRLYQVDLSQPNAVLEFTRQLSNESLFGLVNCAALYRHENLSTVLATWDSVIAVNLTAPMILSTQLGNQLAPGGVILNIASVWGACYGGKYALSYAASKAGLVSLTKTLAYMFRDRSLRVNAIVPSAIDTPMAQSNPPQVIKNLTDKTLLKRLGKPEEIANLVSFLLSPQSSYINGTSIIIDGGTTSWA